MRGAWTMVAATALGGCLVVTDGERAEAPVDKTVEVSGTTKLEAHNVSGRLCVTRGEDGVVAVRGRALVGPFFDGDDQQAAREAAEELSVVVRDGIVRVNDPEASGGSDDPFVTYDLEIAVPLGTEVEAANVSGATCVFGTGGRVEVETVSGDATVHGAQDVVVRGVSGRIVVDAVRTLDAETTSGDVEASSVLGDVSLRTVSGDLVARDLGDDVRVESTSGDVTVSGDVSTAATWEVETVSGDVELVVPTDASFHFELDTMSGDFDAEFSLADFTDTDHLRAVVGGDPDALVSVETVSGDVLLGRLAP